MFEFEVISKMPQIIKLKNVEEPYSFFFPEFLYSCQLFDDDEEILNITYYHYCNNNIQYNIMYEQQNCQCIKKIKTKKVIMN